MDHLKAETMESKSQCEIQHPNPPMPHYALSEGVLPLDLSSTQDSDSETFVRRSGSSRSESVIRSVINGGKKIGSGSVKSGSEIAARGSGSGTSATTIKASDDDVIVEDVDDEGVEHELRSRDESFRDDEDFWKDPHRVHFQTLSRAFTPEDDIFVIYELGDEVTPSPSDWIAFLPSSALAPSLVSAALQTAISAATEVIEGKSDSDTTAATASSSTPASLAASAASAAMDEEIWTPEMCEKALWRESAPQSSTNKDFPNLRSIFVNLASLSICPSDSLFYNFVFVSAAEKKILGKSSAFCISDKPPLDAEVKDITSILEVLVDVGDIPGLDSGSLKHLKSFMEPVQHRSEPDCVVSFKRRPQTTASTDEGQLQHQQHRLLRPSGRTGHKEGDEDEEENDEDVAVACLWDRDGSVEDLLNKSLKMLESVSTCDSFTTVPSTRSSFHSIVGGESGEAESESGGSGGGGGGGGGGGVSCATCGGYREKLEEMRKLQEESQKQIAEIQQKLKEGKEKLAAGGSQSQFFKESSSSRTRKLEEKLRNLRLSKRRLEDELVEAIGRAARSKEEVMEIRQTLHENSNRMEAAFAEMTELKADLTSKEKELKDLHEYVENIHYTLSTKGMKDPKTDDGTGSANDPPVNGKLIDLEATSWSVSESRKKGALRAKLTNQSGVIDHLHHTLGRLDKERGDALRRAEMAEKTCDVQGVEITKLKEAVAKMKQEASKAANRVESLSKIIIQERQTLQTRMEKVREALKKVDSARKLKLAAGNNERVSATGGVGGAAAAGGGGGASGGVGGGVGWGSGSDRAAIAASQRRAFGQEPRSPPGSSMASPVSANSAVGVNGGGGGGGATNGNNNGRSRFVSPASSSQPSQGPANQFFANAAAAAAAASASRTSASGSRGRHQPDPPYTYVTEEQCAQAMEHKGAPRSSKARRRSQSRESKERGRRCPICREAFSPVATKASIQNHINSHNLQHRDPNLSRRPIREVEPSSSSSSSSSNYANFHNGRGGGGGGGGGAGNRGHKDDSRHGRDGVREMERREGRKDGKSFTSSRDKVAGLTKRWNSFAGSKC